MDQEQSQLPAERMAVLFGLTSSRLDRDDHIAEEMRLGGPGPFLLRKSQDIGRTIVIQVVPIEPTDGPITDEDDRDLIARSAQGV